MAQAPSRAYQESVPPLETGDGLTREEFERRWDLHPEIKKAELIEGMVFLEVSVSPRHGRAHAWVSTWLGAFSAQHPEAEVHADVTVRAGNDDVQPDALLRFVTGGRSRWTDEAIEGPPELAVEVAVSSVAKDMHLKKEAYRRAGVQEYLVWQAWDRRVDWWELRDGRYVSIDPDADGVIESRVFAGLRLHVPKLLDGDLAGVLAELTARA